MLPPLLSYHLKCMNCSDHSSGGRLKKWVVLLCTRVVIPTTLLYIFMLLFHVSLLSPKLNGFILFAQYISSPPLVRRAVPLLNSEEATHLCCKDVCLRSHFPVRLVQTWTFSASSSPPSAIRRWTLFTLSF